MREQIIFIDYRNPHVPYFIATWRKMKFSYLRKIFMNYTLKEAMFVVFPNSITVYTDTLTRGFRKVFILTKNAIIFFFFFRKNSSIFFCKSWESLRNNMQCMSNCKINKKILSGVLGYSFLGQAKTFSTHTHIYQKKSKKQMLVIKSKCLNTENHV